MFTIARKERIETVCPYGDQRRKKGEAPKLAGRVAKLSTLLDKRFYPSVASLWKASLRPACRLSFVSTTVTMENGRIFLSLSLSFCFSFLFLHFLRGITNWQFVLESPRILEALESDLLVTRRFLGILFSNYSSISFSARFVRNSYNLLLFVWLFF